MKQLAINGGIPVRTEPFPEWPIRDEHERKAVQNVIEGGKWGYPEWEYVPRFEHHFAVYHDAKFGICFNSGTSALMGALWAAGVQAGDEVVLPAYTFIATAGAVIQLGALPVFADIESTTFHLDARSVDEHISPRTKAVIAVHIGGRSADMSRLQGVCEYHSLALIEDAAQAWGAEWQSKRIGALGDAGVFSFQSSKNITSGEGGIVLTNDEKLAQYCRSFCNCGRREDKPQYKHYYIGGNYRMTELQAAVLAAQFERYPNQLSIRQKNAAYLNTELAKIDGIVPINVDENVTSNAYHLFLIRYKRDYFDDVSKSRFIQALQAEGVPAHPGYTLPIYKQPVFVERLFGARGKQDTTHPDYGNLHLPETENVCSEEGIWLTQNVLLGTKKDMQDIVEAFQKIKNNIQELSKVKNTASGK